jgi:hypothetical protein
VKGNGLSKNPKQEPKKGIEEMGWGLGVPKPNKKRPNKPKCMKPIRDYVHIELFLTIKGCLSF